MDNVHNKKCILTNEWLAVLSSIFKLHTKRGLAQLKGQRLKSSVSAIQLKAHKSDEKDCKKRLNFAEMLLVSFRLKGQRFKVTKQRVESHRKFKYGSNIS